MNSKFALSFGISLIFVSILNLFLKINDMVLFGLSASATMFSIISIFESCFNIKKIELIYILPLMLFISILCFSDSLVNIDWMAKIINGKVTNILTFLSFGLLFVSEFLHSKKLKNRYLISQMELINENMDYSILILKLQNDYLRFLNDNNKPIDDDSEILLEKIEKLCDEKIKLLRIDTELLNKTNGMIDIKELNEIYIKYTDVLNIDKDNDIS